MQAIFNKEYVKNPTFRRSVDNLFEITREKRKLKEELARKENPTNKKISIPNFGGNGKKLTEATCVVKQI